MIEFCKEESSSNCSWWSAGVWWLQNSSRIQIFPLWGTFFPTKFFSLHMNVLVSPLLLEMGYCSPKKSLKFEQPLMGTLKTFLLVAHIFTRICNQLLQKPAAGRKPLDLGSRFRKGRSNTNSPAWNEILDKVPDEIPLSMFHWAYQLSSKPTFTCIFKTVIPDFHFLRNLKFYLQNPHHSPTLKLKTLWSIFMDAVQLPQD